MRERYDEVLEGYTILEDELKEESEFDRLMESFIMKYQVTVARTGYVEIEADNEQEAMDIVANDMNSKDIEWTCDFTVTDCEESEE